jgi:hypothetical protein
MTPTSQHFEPVPDNETKTFWLFGHAGSTQK